MGNGIINYKPFFFARPILDYLPFAISYLLKRAVGAVSAKIFESMNYVYVLNSTRHSKRYIGSTRLRPEERLKQHNSGSNKWTRQNGPFALLYYEEHPTFREARKRENYLKTSSGRRLLDKLCNELKKGA